jgi:hypothetical protein
MEVEEQQRREEEEAAAEMQSDGNNFDQQSWLSEGGRSNRGGHLGCERIT